jgi:hypothetical protein
MVTLSNGFRITFDGVEYNADDDTSTWVYSMEELPSAQDLSNWVLELPGCAIVIDAEPHFDLSILIQMLVCLVSNGKREEDFR